jgi:3-dehydroquinate synthase
MTPAQRFDLRHPRGTTAIVAGEGAFAAARDGLAGALAGRSLFVVSAAPILALHAGALEPLRAMARSVRVLEVPDGEPAKCVVEAERLWSALAAAGAKRDSVIAAFGGGTVGDLAGFAAATFLRGVELVQLPTTLLAQVDAAIGGKTAIDLPEAKNGVGAFHHPSWVVADAGWLATLPAEELRSGLVEAIKTGALLDPDLLERIERDLERLRAGETGALGPVAAGAARAKARLVESDPEETGPRQLLNLGHTLGHALETAAGYGRLRHGDAVAHGLLFALGLAASRGLDPGFGRRLERLIERLGVPPLPALDPAALLELIARDKKAREAGLTWVLPIAPGRAERVVGVPATEVAARLAGFLAEHSGSGPL